jgi:hypothetical protein
MTGDPKDFVVSSGAMDDWGFVFPLSQLAWPEIDPSEG